MKLSLPFIITLVLIYGSVALVAPKLGDPQIEKLLTTNLKPVLIVYTGSFFYFCFLFWMFETGVNLFRIFLSKSLNVEIKEVYKSSNMYSERRNGYFCWDFTGKPYLAWIIYPLETLIYGISILLPILIVGLWSYSEFG